VLWVVAGIHTPPGFLTGSPAWPTSPDSDMLSGEDNHRGCGGAGGFGGGRRGGRVGFGRGGAGAVFPRSQPSRFWCKPRSIIRSPHPPTAATMVADQFDFGASRRAILTMDVANGVEVRGQLVEEGEQFRQHLSNDGCCRSHGHHAPAHD